MRATQEQIAEIAGVTRATVSYVLCGRAKELKITDAVAARVRRAARKLGYTPNHAARALVSGRSMTLGLLLGDAAGHVAPFWSAIAEGVEAEALSAGYDVLLIRARGEPAATGLRCLRERRVDALIALGRSAGGEKAWRDAPVPPVVIRSLGPRGLPCVGLDSRPGIEAAVEHLARLGHRRLMWVGPNYAAADRGEVVRQAAERRGLQAAAVDLGNVANPWTDAADAQIAFWRQMLARAMPKRLPATAVLCWNDRMALGLYAMLAERGLKVPRDVSVVGFDDDEAPLALPPLSSVSHEFAKMGTEATRLALRLVAGELSPGAAAKAVSLVPSRFVPRQSTAPVPEPEN